MFTVVRNREEYLAWHKANRVHEDTQDIKNSKPKSYPAAHVGYDVLHWGYESDTPLWLYPKDIEELSGLLS